MDKENVSPQVPYCYPDYPPNVCLWRNGSTVGMPPACYPLVTLHANG